jgi:hypothetical protein
LTASINGANEVEGMKEGEEQITTQDEEITPQEGEEEIPPPDW